MSNHAIIHKYCAMLAADAAALKLMKLIMKEIGSKKSIM
jgi:hypothetical protein